MKIVIDAWQFCRYHACEAPSYAVQISCSCSPGICTTRFERIAQGRGLNTKKHNMAYHVALPNNTSSTILSAIYTPLQKLPSPPILLQIRTIVQQFIILLPQSYEIINLQCLGMVLHAHTGKDILLKFKARCHL